MLNKIVSVVLAVSVISVAPVAYAKKTYATSVDVEVNYDKFSALNGSTSAIEKYFVSKGGSDELLMKNGSSRLWREPAINRAGIPIHDNHRYGNGKYARIGGECAVFVQQITNAPKTRYWVRGDKVTLKWDGRALVGKTIATFNEDGNYENLYGRSHVAIVLAAWRSAAGNGPIDSVWVLDSNWVVGPGKHIVGRHRILKDNNKKRKDYSFVGDLDNYYVVRH